MFFDRLSLLCEEKGIELSNVLKAIGLSTSKGTAWRKGSYPRADQLVSLCKFFDVSMDYLCGLSDIKMPAEKISGLTDDVVSILVAYQKAPRQIQEAVKRVLTAP